MYLTQIRCMRILLDGVAMFYRRTKMRIAFHAKPFNKTDRHLVALRETMRLAAADSDNLGRAHSGLACRQLGCLMFGDERINHIIQRLTRDDLIKLVKREIDTMIRHAPLRKIISADAL